LECADWPRTAAAPPQVASCIRVRDAEIPSKANCRSKKLARPQSECQRAHISPLVRLQTHRYELRSERNLNFLTAVWLAETMSDWSSLRILRHSTKPPVSSRARDVQANRTTLQKESFPRQQLVSAWSNWSTRPRCLDALWRFVRLSRPLSSTEFHLHDCRQPDEVRKAHCSRYGALGRGHSCFEGHCRLTESCVRIRRLRLNGWCPS
jgi:hypothetical protein